MQGLRDAGRGAGGCWGGLPGVGASPERVYHTLIRPVLPQPATSYPCFPCSALSLPCSVHQVLPSCTMQRLLPIRNYSLSHEPISFHPVSVILSAICIYSILSSSLICCARSSSAFSISCSSLSIPGFFSGIFTTCSNEGIISCKKIFKRGLTNSLFVCYDTAISRTDCSCKLKEEVQ